LTAAAPEQAEQARAIAREMGGLPLSLDIAGAVIKGTATSLVEFLQLYRAEEGRVLRQERDPNDPYEHSVAKVFALAFRQVATPEDEREEAAVSARAAADLLRLCAFFAPDAVPLELILTDTAALGEDLQRALEHKIWRKKTIAKATRFSLLDANPQAQTYDMHREVQAVLRDEMDDETQRLWVGRGLQTLVEVFPNPNDFATWGTCDLLLPHAQDCLRHGDRLKIETTAVAWLKNHTGYHLENRARYAEAEPLYVQALALSKKLLGEEHPDVATSLNNLAGLYYSQGRYAEAEPLFAQALALTKKLLGEEHPDVAGSVNNLAELYRVQGRYAEAEPLYVQALALWQKLLGEEHPNVATSMNNLALLYRAQRRYTEAEPVFVQTLALRKKLLGEAHPDVAQSLNNLAFLYHAQGRYAEAEPLYVQALALFEKTLGENHPHTSIARRNFERFQSEKAAREAQQRNDKDDEVHDDD